MNVSLSSSRNSSVISLILIYPVTTAVSVLLPLASMPPQDFNLLKIIRLSERDIENGNYRSADEVMNEIKRKYEIND